MRLTDDELRDVLARAEEIQRASVRGDEVNAELEAVVAAAEEVGLSRPAVERALRERLTLSPAPAPGGLVFAESADGKFYVAEVLSVSMDGARVRFLGGSEHLVTLDQLRPCSLLPGERVVCNWPWFGPRACTVVTYDAAKRRVQVSDRSGYTRTVPLAEVSLNRPRTPGTGGARGRVYATLVAASVAVGALVGSIITALVMG